MKNYTHHALLAALLLLSAIPATAADDWTDRLTISGYFTQGFAVSDGLQILGITDEVTGDYRTGALQFRYEMSDKDLFVLQMDHERLGDSPSQPLRDDLGVDWFFYQRELGPTTTVSVGRVPLPIGIYNEIKDVGTLLPFFRASTSIYGDGTWTTESIDGIVLKHEFAGSSDWSLETSLYYGDYERIEDDTSIQAVEVVPVTNTVGVQLWLNTPVSGLRFGFGANRYDVTGGLFLPPGVTDTQEDMYFSIDADFGRVALRSEYYDDQYEGGFWKGWNTELFLRATDQWTFIAAYDKGDLKFTVPFFAVFDEEWSNDFALGANYAVRPDLVLKLEYHWHEGYDIEGQNVDSFFGPQLEVEYAIASVSVHF